MSNGNDWQIQGGNEGANSSFESAQRHDLNTPFRQANKYLAYNYSLPPEKKGKKPI